MKTRFHIHNNYRKKVKITPVTFFAIIAIIVLCVLIILDIILKPDSVDILVEFHGLFFDLIIFGIILTLYDLLNKKRERIDSLHDQLDDFWEWKTEEGVLRKVGIIKRLIELNHPIPRMTAIHLPGADFYGMEFNRLIFQNCYLQNSKFHWAKLNDSFFSGSDFSSSNFEHSKFIKSTIAQCDFSYANMKFVDFGDSTIRGNVNFKNSNLHCADFRKTILKPEAFGHPDFTDADLSETNFIGVDLSYCKGLTKKQIESAKTDNAILPDYL